MGYVDYLVILKMLDLCTSKYVKKIKKVFDNKKKKWCAFRLNFAFISV